MNSCECVEPSRKLYTTECLKCGKQIAEAADYSDQYRFRAECLADVTGFLNNLWPGCRLLWVKINPDLSLPGCDVVVRIAGTDLEEIRIALSRVPNGHVMMQTLNHAAEYTGEQSFVPLAPFSVAPPGSMKGIKFRCLLCGKEFEIVEECNACEESHQDS
jgi:hypothetical protein